jgi:hypothetical protein
MSPHVQCQILRRLGYMQTQVGCGRVVCRHCRGCLAQWRDLGPHREIHSLTLREAVCPEDRVSHTVVEDAPHASPPLAYRNESCACRQSVASRRPGTVLAPLCDTATHPVVAPPEKHTPGVCYPKH